MGIVKQPLHEISDAFLSIDEMVNNGDISEDDIVDQIEAIGLSVLREGSCHIV